MSNSNTPNEEPIVVQVIKKWKTLSGMQRKIALNKFELIIQVYCESNGIRDSFFEVALEQEVTLRNVSKSHVYMDGRLNACLDLSENSLTLLEAGEDYYDDDKPRLGLHDSSTTISTISSTTSHKKAHVKKFLEYDFDKDEPVNEEDGFNIKGSQLQLKVMYSLMTEKNRVNMSLTTFRDKLGLEIQELQEYMTGERDLELQKLESMIKAMDMKLIIEITN